MDAAYSIRARRVSLLASIAALALAAWPSTAAGQVQVGPTVSRMEVSGYVSFMEGAGYGPSFRYNFGERHALQVSADFSTANSDFYRDLQTFYTIAYRYTLPVNIPSARLFITAGGTGLVYRSEQLEHTLTLPADWYVNLLGETVIIPERVLYYPHETYVSGEPPLYPTLGFGTDIRVHSRFSVHGEAQFVIYEEGVSPRLAAGLTVSLGKVLR